MPLLTTFSTGVAAGLWLAGAPRLVAVASFVPALLAGVALASRVAVHRAAAE